MHWDQPRLGSRAWQLVGYLEYRRRKLAPEAFPQRQSQHVEVGAFQLFFLRLSSAGNHTVHLLLLWASSYTFFLEL